MKVFISNFTNEIVSKFGNCSLIGRKGDDCIEIIEAIKDTTNIPQLPEGLSIVGNSSEGKILIKDSEITIEKNDSFIKRINFIWMKIILPSSLSENSQRLAQIQEFPSEIFYSEGLTKFTKAEKKKGKKGGKAAPKETKPNNGLKEFVKELRSKLKIGLEESTRMNKPLGIPCITLNLFCSSSNPDAELSIQFSETASLHSSSYFTLLPLDSPIESNISNLLNSHLEGKMKNINGFTSFWSEFSSVPFLVNSTEKPYLRDLGKIPEQFPIRNIKHVDEFLGKPVNVHKFVQSKSEDEELSMIKGNYAYFHYLQDGFNDEGWGCAYRSLQTLLSWYVLTGIVENSKFQFPRYIKQIQQLLLSYGEQPPDFVGSDTWIGSIEVGYMVSHLTSFEHKIIFLQDGADVVTIIRQLKEHFNTVGSPIMFGGSMYAYTLLGIIDSPEPKFLILDPHFTGSDSSKAILEKKGVSWKTKEMFQEGNYYNFCLPQLTKVND